MRTLTGQLTGLLNDLREAIEKEVARDASLPRNLAQEAFSYFVELDRRRQQRRRKPRSTEQPEAGAPD